MALFKELQSAMDPTDSEGHEFLKGLIKNLTQKMKYMKAKKIPNNSDYGFSNYGLLFIGLGLSAYLSLATRVLPEVALALAFLFVCLSVCLFVCLSVRHPISLKQP